MKRFSSVARVRVVLNFGTYIFGLASIDHHRLLFVVADLELENWT
jgi:hypothetical protein